MLRYHHILHNLSPASRTHRTPSCTRRPGLMDPSAPPWPPTLLGWDQSWPMSGHQASRPGPHLPLLFLHLCQPRMQSHASWTTHCLTRSASSSQSTIPDHRACLPQQSTAPCGLLPACCVCPLSSRQVLGQLTYSAALSGQAP